MSIQDVKVQQLIVASVATMGVYRRLAKLSDEERQEVIEKVKGKMNLKDDAAPEGEPAPEAPEGEPEPEAPEGEAAPEAEGDGPSELAPVEEIKKDEESTTEETPETDGPSELAPVEEIQKDEEEVVEAPTEEEPSELAPVEEMPGNDGTLEPPAESTKPEGVQLGDGYEEDDDDDEENGGIDDNTKGEATNIVEELVREVQTIKEDGHVSPSEVLGLITQMMEMVNLLVEAKAPIRRRRKSSVREFLIAEKVMTSQTRRGK